MVMPKRAYLSNVTAIWPLPKQREVLAALPGWPSAYVLFEDEIDARQRRRKNSRVLVQRNEMLRVTTRPQGSEEMFVAALPVFAMSIEDAIHALTLAGARGAIVHFLHEGLTVAPASGAETLHTIATAFAQAKLDGRAATAGQISGAKKEVVAKADCERVRPLYGHPTGEVSWAELERVSGRTRNTVIKHLGPRKPHQVDWLANQKQAAARTKRKDLRR